MYPNSTELYQLSFMTRSYHHDDQVSPWVALSLSLSQSYFLEAFKFTIVRQFSCKHLILLSLCTATSRGYVICLWKCSDGISFQLQAFFVLIGFFLSILRDRGSCRLTANQVGEVRVDNNALISVIYSSLLRHHCVTMC